MNFSANLCNGDFILFNEQSILYYRKSLITPKQYGYIVKIFKRGDTLPFGPMLRAIRLAMRHMESQYKPGFVEAAFPLPTELIWDSEADTGMKAVEKSICHTTGQSLNRYEATRDLVFPHPTQSGNDERVYKVDKGSVSGFMPWHAAEKGCWVDESSFFSGTGAGSLITNHSRVVCSVVMSSWIRQSLVDHSTLSGCVVQKASTMDCDLLNSGVRNATLEEVNAKRTSFNQGNYGVVRAEDCRLHGSSLVNSVLVNTSADDSNAQSGHVVDCELQRSNVYDSFVKNYRLQETTVTNSRLEWSTMRELTHGMVVHGTPRISTYDHNCIRLTVGEQS